MSTVSVVGAGGHVGFPFSVVVANAGHMVYGIDINSPLCTKMNAGFIPYVEHGVSEPLKTALSAGNLFFTTKTNVITKSDVIAIMIGTPVDSENNPRLDELLNFIKYELVDNFRKGQLIILRSTVSPGTTELIRDILDSETGQEEGKDYHLVFCPERVAQGHGIEESKKFPQLIGAFNEIGFVKASAFFKTFVENDCFFLTPREAEIGKLITNMYRYVNFALANEFYMISHDQSVNIHKVIEACNKDYPRMNLPLPGPNVGGPCLFKDGRFLITDVPYADLINTSFLINEGMPDFIFKQIKSLRSDGLVFKKILILGMAFKANNEDTRNSLSFKMRKVAIKNGCDVICIDPFIAKYRTENLTPIQYDAIILMTPHDKFKDWLSENLSYLMQDTVIVDMWKHFPESKKTTNGIYLIKDIVNV